MDRFYSLRLIVVAVVALVTMTQPDSATAKERSYSSRGTAQFVSPNDFVGKGTATHLGRYTEIGNVQFSPTPDPAVLQIDGWVTYTAANGDELDATVTGQLNAVTGAITATVTYDGGTGRFDDASGSATLTGQMLPDGTITVVVKGFIDF